MGLIEGRHIRKVLIQNIWKILGAFIIGVIAVVGGGLIVSDVHRIPQGMRSSPKAVSESQPQRSQPLWVSGDSTTGSPPPIAEAPPEQLAGAGAESTAQEVAAAAARRRPSSKTHSKVPNESLRVSATPNPMAVSPASET